MKNQYTAFAPVYDRMMHDVDRNAWIDYLDGFLRDNGAHRIMDCACGTGATASAYATMVSGLCDRDVTIHLLGGDLEISLGEDGHLFMTGAATEVFHGEIELK